MSKNMYNTIEHAKAIERANEILNARADVKYYAYQVSVFITKNPAMYRMMSAKLDRACDTLRGLLA